MYMYKYATTVVNSYTTSISRAVVCSPVLQSCLYWIDEWGLLATPLSLPRVPPLPPSAPSTAARKTRFWLASVHCSGFWMSQMLRMYSVPSSTYICDTVMVEVHEHHLSFLQDVLIW
ncbi:hypothetical protein BU24DRAFT_146093 [Aaosphaeria arxii CBS 175.79]|uniref:Uncharacterized protein n=1 Tax=Aaosphaeria arxii CBS 175.79 TaxID=1450172 RepID=A0A6A5XWJ3_9PLEO|nr:uncharacterized protein BU24DRAFT_146093 [Aaosphaeria arxii CBS 175.79]KAF2017217.1 hypothetical protein BU24DRAFT_146093 [Aaosphaeria arxii CBS 175.79]